MSEKADKEIERFDKLCNQIVSIFADKQELPYGWYWVGDEVGGVVDFGDTLFFSLTDIIFDLRTNQKPGFIIEWNDAGLDFNMFNENPKFINYKSYCKGARYEMLSDGE